MLHTFQKPSIASWLFLGLFCLPAALYGSALPAVPISPEWAAQIKMLWAWAAIGFALMGFAIFLVLFYIPFLWLIIGAFALAYLWNTWLAIRLRRLFRRYKRSSDPDPAVWRQLKKFRIYVGILLTLPFITLALLILLTILVLLFILSWYLQGTALEEWFGV